MLFTELNTDALLHIYRYLDPIDSINLAETCTKLRDVAQLHYKRFKIFNLKNYLKNYLCWTRHNRIDAITVLKQIGPFIRVIEGNFDPREIGSDVSTSIKKYCVNVQILKMYEGRFNQSYSLIDWLRKLNVTKWSLSIQDLFLIDLSETTTLDELRIYSRFDDGYKVSVDHGYIANIFERNCNITCLRIPLTDGFQYEVFEKLGCLKRLQLDIEYGKSGKHLEKVSANLKMMALEKVVLNFSTRNGVDGLNEFLQKLSENALHLRDLSILGEDLVLYTDNLASLQLLHLKSLRWIDEHRRLYNEIPKIQPNLTHLHLFIYGGTAGVGPGETLAKPMEQIIFLIKSLEKLEFLHLQFVYRRHILSMLNDFLQESILCRVFDCHSINRPSMTLRLGKISVPFRCLNVELDFDACKWTWTTIEEDRVKFFEENQSPISFYHSNVETMDDSLAVHRFSGSVSDLNSVRDEAIKWIKRFLKYGS